MSAIPTPAKSCAVCETHVETAFRIDGMDCPNEVEMLERRLKHLPGIHELRADVLARRLLVSHDSARVGPAAIAHAVAETGLRAFVEQGPQRMRDDGFGQLRFWLLVASCACMSLSTVGSWVGWPFSVL